MIRQEKLWYTVARLLLKKVPSIGLPPCVKCKEDHDSVILVFDHMECKFFNQISDIAVQLQCLVLFALLSFLRVRVHLQWAWWASQMSNLMQKPRNSAIILFKQHLTAYVEKIYGLFSDSLKKEISPLLNFVYSGTKIYKDQINKRVMQFCIHSNIVAK